MDGGVGVVGTGRHNRESRPTWIWAWLSWLLSELLRSPGEQQTEIVQRHFPQMPFYRLDPDFKRLDPTLDHDIGLDDVGSSDWLRTYGERFAAMIDWDAILSGTDTTFRVAASKTLWYQYKRP